MASTSGAVRHSLSAVARRPAAWPWWLQVLALYAATRLWSTAVFLLAAAAQPESYWAPAQPGYADFVGLFWDASWYRSIAENGYPGELPRDAAGGVQQNAWAFYPLFPLLVRGLMAFGGSWAVLAPAASLVFGAAAALVLDRLVQGRVDAAWATGERRLALGSGERRLALSPGERRLALGTVLLVGLHPAAPVLQAGYAEALALLLVALVLWLLVRRSYVAAASVVLALGFTRPVALPMAAVVAVHLAARWREARVGRDVLPRTDVARILGLGFAAVVAGTAWPVIAGWVTGVPDAYVRTQAAWRGTFSSYPLIPWVQMAEYLMGPAGFVVLVLVTVAAFALALSPPAAVAGVEVQAWGVAYLAYLLLVAFPQTSLIRFLVLAFPLALALVALARGRRGLLALAVAGALSQLVWVVWLWQLTTPTAWPP
jgi:hypothetical protein